MSLIIKNVKIKNFMRIKNADIDVPELGVIGIIAENKTDPDKSNFQGKTTVLEAMKYALTGKSRAKSELSLIHYGEEVMEVKLTLLDKDSNEEFIITRGRDSKNNGLIEYSDSKRVGEKSSEANRYIEELIGMNPDDFDLTIFFKQAEINQFMDLSPTEKKKMLMKWQDNDHWEEKEQKVLREIKLKKEEAHKLKITLENLNNEIGNLDKLEREYQEIEAEYKQTKILVETLKKKWETLSEKSKISEEEFEEAKRKEPKLLSDLKKYKLLLEETKQKEKELEQLEKFNLEKIEKNIEKLQKESNEVNLDLRELKRRKEDLGKIKDGICPIINEYCEKLKNSKERAENLDKKIESKSKEFNKIQKTLEEVRTSLLGAKKNNATIEALISFVSNKLMNENYFNRTIESLNEVRKTLKNFDEEALEKIEEVRFDLEEETRNYMSLNGKYEVIKSKIKQVHELEEKAAELRENIINLNTDLDDYQFVAFMFGKNGIPSLEIENSFQEIEDEVNFLLGEVTHQQISFKPDRELRSWEDFCLSCGFKYPKGYRKQDCEKCGTLRRKKRKDELTIKVLEGTNETDFEMCSGGLKTLISLSVRTALTNLRRRQNQSNLNVIFLDEIDSALDKTNKAHIVDLINNVICKRLGFDQVFWISHDRNISSNVPHTLLVEGLEDHSKVGWL